MLRPTRYGRNLFWARPRLCSCVYSTCGKADQAVHMHDCYAMILPSSFLSSSTYTVPLIKHCTMFVVLQNSFESFGCAALYLSHETHSCQKLAGGVSSIQQRSVDILQSSHTLLRYQAFVGVVTLLTICMVVWYHTIIIYLVGKARR